MAKKIDGVGARASLKPQTSPYYVRVRSGCHLGYRKLTDTSAGTWIARVRDEISGKYQTHGLGSLDHIPATLRYDEAIKLASEWFDHHRRASGVKTGITVGDACNRLVTKYRNENNENAARDAEGRFRRWVFSDPRFSSTALLKLTSESVDAWRTKLANTPVIHQDKNKITDRRRATSSLNRDMATVRAALNLAYEDGYVPSDRAWLKKLKQVDGAGGRRDCYLDREQRRGLISAAGSDAAATASGRDGFVASGKL